MWRRPLRDRGDLRRPLLSLQRVPARERGASDCDGRRAARGLPRDHGTPGGRAARERDRPPVRVLPDHRPLHVHGLGRRAGLGGDRVSRRARALPAAVPPALRATAALVPRPRSASEVRRRQDPAPGSAAVTAPPRVVILGGGFAGLKTAQALRRAPVDVTMIDRRNHHLFQPLLYQVATAALNPSDIAAPIRRVLRHQRNCRVLLAEATAIDLARRRVVLDQGELEYDYLVVATGATHSYFGHAEWEPFAPSLKSIEDALTIRRRVLRAYEAAERSDDPAARSAYLTFVVVGAGPTGVELSGALSEIARHALEADFRTIDPQDARVILLEAGPRVLPTFPPDLSEKATAQLARLGVEVRVGAHVTQIDADGVQIGAERVVARTVIWAAGVAASPLGRSLGVPLDRAGRVLVEPTLALPGHPEVFVIGDLAVHRQDGKTV